MLQSTHKNVSIECETNGAVVCALVPKAAWKRTDELDKSKQIEGFVESINDIAAETTLLSLNASIEAARAGDAVRIQDDIVSGTREMSIAGDRSFLRICKGNGGTADGAGGPYGKKSGGFADKHRATDCHGTKVQGIVC